MQNFIKRSIGTLLVLVMLLALLPAAAFAADTMTIKVTANTDSSNPTMVGVYERGSYYYKEQISYPVTFVKTEGGYDIYTASPASSGILIVSAYVPGVTNKAAQSASAGSTVTLNLTTPAPWSAGGSYSDNMYTNLNDNGTLNLDVGQSFDLDTFRVWQALGSSASENIYVEPEFYFEVIGDSISTMTIGGAGREQLKITAEQTGVSVIKITYGPVSINGSNYKAIEPSNTYAVVVNVNGGANFNTGINTPGGVEMRNDFDTVYFNKTIGSTDFTFTPASGSTVKVHPPIHTTTWDTGWINGTESGGAWTVPLTEGRNIIEVTNGTSTRYHIVKARGVTIGISNLSTPNEPIAVGETARITIRGIESPIQKMAGVYNPGFSIKPYLRYTSGAATVKSDSSGQYELLQKTFVVDYTLSDKDENVLNGRIQGGGGFWGVGMTLGEHRNFPLSGVGPSIGAAPDMGEIFFGILPEIELTVDETRSAISPFTEDGWLIVDCGTGGTNANNSLTQKIRDLVGAANLDTVKKLKVIGTMTNWDFYNNTAMTTAYGALTSGNNNTRDAMLTELIELDLSEATIATLPNQALRRIRKLEKLRLPANIITVNHVFYNLPALTTVAFGDAPYVEGVIDLTGFTGSSLAANVFGQYVSDPGYSGTSTVTKLITQGALGVPENGFLGLISLQEVIFTGDTLGTISTTKAFVAGIKATAVAYIPDGADKSKLTAYFDTVKFISEYPAADAGLLTAKTELADALVVYKQTYSTNPGYSEYMWDVLEKAIDDADTILTYDDYILTVTALEGAKAVIEDAIAALTPDKTALKDAIADAIDYSESDWTTASWSVFTSALDYARSVYYDKNASLTEVTTAYSNLDAAITGLEEPLGDKSWLEGYIALFGTSPQSDFTADGNFTAFEAAMNAAKAVVADPTATVKEVNIVEEAFVNAMNLVVYIGDLRYEITNAKTLAQANYTAATWSVFATALSAAETVLAKADATKIEVDTSASALRSAVLNLQSANTGGGGGTIQPPKSMTVTFRLIGDTKHDSFEEHDKYVTWIATKSYTFNNVDRVTVYDLFTRALDDAKLGYKGAETNYISSIQAPAVLGGYWLSEFDNGPNSGWMYTVDGVHPGYGLKEEYIYHGEEIIWQYVDDYTAETSFEGRNPLYPERWLEAPDVNPGSGSNSGSGAGAVAQVKQEINPVTETTNGVTTATVANNTITNALTALTTELAKPANSGKTGEVVLNVDSTSTTTAIKTNVSAEAIQAIANAGNVVLTVNGELGAVTLDSKTLEGIASAASANDEITIEIAAVKADTLPAAQKEVAGDSKVFEVEVTVAGTAIHNLSGTATVTLPYALKSGESANSLTVYHLAADGTLTEMKDAKYDSDKRGFVFTTTHFSVFIVAKKGLTGEIDWENPFVDVTDEDWFYEAVRYVCANELMNGTSATEFSPRVAMTRAMMVQVLYNYEGKPAVTAKSAFTDVADDAWYADAVIWANSNGIASGYGNAKFGPNDQITREQMALILYNYTKSKDIDVSEAADISAYTDTDEIADWALAALKWANAMGLITGRTETTLAPKGTALRSEMASVLMRFVENVTEAE